MKDFNEFLASITSDDVASIMSDANQKAAEIRAKTTSTEKTGLGDQIGIVSYTIALEILGLYHKWLEQDS
ncbi:MAG: hypothetical protein K2O84_06330 [Oscillospiraceae bacterium]|nr:hypothetical protein [Oscillospiraceae bacterium]